MKLFRFPEDSADIARILSKTELASLLVPFVTEDIVQRTCAQAVSCGMAGVLAVPDICVQTVKLLEGTGVAPVCMVSSNEVVDNCTETRLLLVRELLKAGVRDVDVGAAAGMSLDGRFDEITEEVRALAEALHAEGGRLGTVLEINQLPEEAMFRLCEAAIEGGADYLRISSGMELMGAMEIGRATIHNTAVLHERFGDRIRIKAGGGWDYAWLEDMNEYLEAGAARVDAGPCTITQLERIGYLRK